MVRPIIVVPPVAPIIPVIFAEHLVESVTIFLESREFLSGVGLRRADLFLVSTAHRLGVVAVELILHVIVVLVVPVRIVAVVVVLALLGVVLAVVVRSTTVAAA